MRASSRLHWIQYNLKYQNMIGWEELIILFILIHSTVLFGSGIWRSVINAASTLLSLKAGRFNGQIPGLQNEGRIVFAVNEF